MSKYRVMTTTAVFACALAVAACGEETATTEVETDKVNRTDPPEETRGAQSASAKSGKGKLVAVADIVAHPNRYLGKTVTVEADVEEVLSPFSFALDEDAPLAGGIDNDFLVFSPQAASLMEIDDQWLDNKVRVTGTVGKMTIVELEREIGWDLDPQIERELEDVQALLIAQSIERVQG
jgi:hypothetical protein